MLTMKKQTSKEEVLLSISQVFFLFNYQLLIKGEAKERLFEPFINIK